MIRTPITFPGGKPLTRSVVAQIVQVTARYESRVMIEHDQKIVNAKSMLGLLSLGLVDQSKLTLLVEGADEKEATEAIIEAMK